MGAVARIVAGAATIYCAVVLLLWALQDGLIFHPATGEYRATPDVIDASWRDIRLTTVDGVELAAWFIEGPTPDAPVVLFFHGNAGDMADRLGILAALHEAGAATLIIDYRGYGGSGGRPGERGFHRDAEAAWEWLTGEAGYEPERIVVHGRSLGGAVAARLAARHRPAGLVLESVFSSLPELAQDLYPWLPAAWLVRYRFDTAARVAETDCPLLLAHSPDDEVIPADHADRLAAIRPQATRRVELTGPHNAASLDLDRHWWSALGAFIQRHAGGADPR